MCPEFFSSPMPTDVKYRAFFSAPAAPTVGDGAALRHPVAQAAPPDNASVSVPRPEYGMPRTSAMHRMPPVLQFVVPVDANLSGYLINAALQRHLAGADSRAVCDEVYMIALRQGFHATINVQEVVAAGMPSFPGQRILTTLVMVDLQHA